MKTPKKGRPRPALRKTKSYNPLAVVSAKERVDDKVVDDQEWEGSPISVAITNEKECRVCKKSFKHFGHLFNHMKKFHNAINKGEKRNANQQVDAKEMPPVHDEGEERHNLSDMDEPIIRNKEDEEEEDGATSVLNDSIMTPPADFTSLPRKTKDGYVCPVCQNAYKQKEGLKVHVDVQHLGITLNCKHCDKKFKSPSALYQHVKKIHDAAAKSMEDPSEQDVAGQRLYNCKVCNSNFNTVEDLDMHRMIYH